VLLLKVSRQRVWGHGVEFACSASWSPGSGGKQKGNAVVFKSGASVACGKGSLMVDNEITPEHTLRALNETSSLRRRT